MKHSFPAASLILFSVIIELLPACDSGPGGLSRDYATVKAEFERVCTGCHTLDPVMNKSRDVVQWKDTVERMKLRGAKVEEWMLVDFPRYLAHVRGPK